MARRERQLETTQTKLSDRSKELDRRERQLETTQAQLSARSQDMDSRQRQLETTQTKLYARSQDLNGRERQLDTTQTQVNDRSPVLRTWTRRGGSWSGHSRCEERPEQQQPHYRTDVSRHDSCDTQRSGGRQDDYHSHRSSDRAVGKMACTVCCSQCSIFAWGKLEWHASAHWALLWLLLQVRL